MVKFEPHKCSHPIPTVERYIYKKINKNMYKNKLFDRDKPL